MPLRSILSLVYLLMYVSTMVGLKDRLTIVAPAEITFSIVVMTGLFVLFAIFVVGAVLRMDIVDTIIAASATKKKP